MGPRREIAESSCFATRDLRRGRARRGRRDTIAEQSGGRTPSPCDIYMLMLATTALAIASTPARLLVLDTLLPGQQLRCEAPPAAFRTLVEGSQAPLVVVGSERLSLHSRGVEVVATAERDDIILTATGRLADVAEQGEDEGSRWAGRAGSVRWLGSLGADDSILSPNDDPSAQEEDPERNTRFSYILGDLVTEWATLVRSTGRERSPGQLDRIIDGLGAVPPPEAPNALAIYAAALINPQPALGVALEVRPAVLTALTTQRRGSMVWQGLTDSIERLQRSGPCF